MFFSKKLEKFENLKHCFFSRKNGFSKGPYASLNCGLGSGDKRDDILKNLNLVSQKIGCKNDLLITLNQTHSDEVVYFKNESLIKNKLNGDAMITKVKNIGIGVLTADCAPILLYDPSKKIIGCIHSGWKGALKGIIKKAAATTFNSITVDGDTSTNDMVSIFATGKAKNSKIYNILDPKLQDFEKALHKVCLNLAKQIVVDGEGAKKFITINVIGARSASMAKNIGFSIANSPLFKTAMAGEDPNWGRIAMAIGKSKENIIPNKIQIKIGNFLVAEQSKVAKDYKESDVKEYMKWGAIDIEVNLNIGQASHTVYTCDFTHDYIDINADYRN